MVQSYSEFLSQKKSKLVDFNGKVFILGYGSVGQAILPIVLKHIQPDSKKIIVLEKDNDNKEIFDKRNILNNVKYVSLEIVKTNLESTLSKYLVKGDFLIDVSLNIGAIEIMSWCASNDVKYINTSLERWANQQDETIPKLSERTLYHEHQVVRKAMSKFKGTATCVVTHGANPGLVTHLTKRALLKLAEHKKKKIETPSSKEEWAQLMKSLGVKVVHIAERDTQIIDKPKQVNEFTNSWSCEGFWAEGRAPAEMGYGTHEEKILENGTIQGNSAFFHQPGVSVLMKSFVPKGGAYNGFLVQHSEAITISEYFETADKKFRPSVYYVYQPTDTAIASVHEFRGRELDMQTKTRIIKDEIISGIDELGVLLITDDECFWHGSQLSIDEARKLIAGENATSLQVVASMLGAIVWAINNPNEGYVEPESIPFEEVLKHADQYLGNVPFVPSKWRPERDKNDLFARDIDMKNKCRWENFRVWDSNHV